MGPRNPVKKHYKLPPPEKEYLCFQNYGENSRAAQYVKSRALTEVVNSILDIQ